jgi:hypothetical protein
MHSFVIQLLTRAGFDPREVAVMGEWICNQTSLARSEPGSLAVEPFAESVASRIRQAYPDGLPAGLMR